MSSSVADVCSSSRDGGGSGNASGGSAGVNSGDWICGDVTCHHSNFARRKQCNKCHRDRSQERSSSVGSSGSNKKKLGTEIGKVAAEKSRGLFSAEDWQCNKCANVNWARRNTCNMCNAPKFCENEERTGFGGGYNDRGVVEYKEREESDSEYDEFGRLKKKKDERPQVVKTIKEKTIEEEDDDEEDDGDDEDLAKYNLFSDDEDAIPAKTTNKESPKNSISKSSNKFENSSVNRRSRSKNRSDVRRRQSRSSSSDGSSSSSSSTSSTSTSSSSSSSSSRSSISELSTSRNLGSIKKRTYSNSRSRSRSLQKSEAKRQRSLSQDRNMKKINILKPSSVKSEERRTGYTSNSRSKSRSSNHSSRSPSSKRNHSRNSKSSANYSPSPAKSHRKRSSRSRSLTPKRRR